MGLHRSTSPRATVTAYALVVAQFALLLVLLLWDPVPRWVIPPWLDRLAAVMGALGGAWLLLGILGLGRSVSAVPLPVAHGMLKTRGLFRLSRHPIYTGLLAIAWSAAVRTASPWPAVVALALTALLVVKARFEEAALRDTYAGYADYAACTPRFLPFGGLPTALRRHRDVGSAGR